ncbi:hypothetical protein SmJEL517_g00927 [Synchytrium microbalum]|uniref:NFACT RNA-binding domain-containing protein n=1 Tax=Synchytrium microbalum TaxID=1806994 RepID=A0A507CC65_9FUNG|nr:uncharacterized protein SmJEL517_g00927 [Synchytrium microbalum]TPX37091.1 hypothetical protein SmJEL517_g00927 [Synchytrium microbalum]
MKQRFSALDVSAAVADLAPLLGSRLQNVYDINSRTYLFKFSVKATDSKELLLIESGIRMHTTEFKREKNMFPSAFCMKLRKHIQSKRIKDIKQTRADRIVDMTFGEGEAAYHVMLEFYSGGNILLCDHEYKILSLLRSVEVDATTELSEKPDTARFAVGATYRLDLATDFHPATETRLRQVLAGPAPERDETQSSTLPSEPFMEPAVTTTRNKKIVSAALKQKKKKKDTTLKKVIRDGFGSDYGSAVTDHILFKSRLDGSLKVPEDIDHSEASPQIQALMTAFGDADKIVKACFDTPQKGYIILQQPNSDSPQQQQTSSAIYDEFHPYLFAQFENRQYIEFQSFNLALDTYFSKIEAQKLEAKTRQAEINAQKRIEIVKAGHESQIKGLASQQEENQKIARAIEINMVDIDSLLQTLRSLIASGMDWKDLDKLVKDEKKKGNKIAGMITGLKMEVGMVSISLRDPDDEEGEDEDQSDEASDEAGSADSDESDLESTSQATPVKSSSKPSTSRPPLAADIYIYASAFANARRYYGAKKIAVVKQEKTQEAAEKAVKSAERKILHELKTTQKQVPTITKVRKPFWFEKFLWFISSENFLVVGGRDAQQNEILVKKHLRKGDVYIHADLNGASSVIVKNSEPNASPPAGVSFEEWSPIPPDTLLQAATMSVCQSNAWTAKIITSAYFVHPHQVSKSAPTGEYLNTGSFMIRGKKHWLPPVQLIFGYGLLFRVSDEDIGRHYFERRPWGRNGEQPLPAGVAESSTIPSRLQSSESLMSPPGSVANFADDEGHLPAIASSDVESGDDAPASMMASIDASATSPDKGNAEGGFDASDGEMGDSEEDEAGDVSQIHRDKKQSDNVSIAPSKSGYDKYNLDELDDEADNEPSPAFASITASVSTEGKSSRPSMSAKQRRDLKKKRQHLGGENVESKSSISSTPEPSTKQPSTSSGKPPPAPPPVRGKKAKLKKQKAKYGGQDEEEKQLALEILGSAKGPQPKGKKEKELAKQKVPPSSSNNALDQKAFAGSSVSKSLDQTTPDPATNLTSPLSASERKESIKRPQLIVADNDSMQTPKSKSEVVLPKDDDNSDSGSSNSDNEASEAIEPVEQQTDTQVHAGGDGDSVIAVPEEDEQGEEDLSMNFLDSLTGQPHEEDTLLFAIPVCAPFSALNRYKYKVKLVPGSLKKGKAAKQALDAFIKVATAVPERDLMKRIPGPESIQTMMGKVKLMGIDEAKSSAKKGKGKS